MSDRYTVSENPFGYEADVGTARLRYALTDNRPTHVSVYRAAVRESVLVPNKSDDPNAPYAHAPFRHICYGPHKEDLQALADAMNSEQRNRDVAARVRDQQERDHGL